MVSFYHENGLSEKLGKQLEIKTNITKEMVAVSKIMNISLKEDKYFDKFPISFHISRSGIVLGKNGLINRNIAKEWGLKLLSCDYGDNSVAFDMHPSMHRLISLVENTYGKISVNNHGVLGFYSCIEIQIQNGSVAYFIAAGNNGQELSTGVYMSSEVLLDDEMAKKEIQNIDSQFFDFVERAGVSKIDDL